MGLFDSFFFKSLSVIDFENTKNNILVRTVNSSKWVDTCLHRAQLNLARFFRANKIAA